MHNANTLSLKWIHFSFSLEIHTAWTHKHFDNDDQFTGNLDFY